MAFISSLFKNSCFARLAVDIKPIALIVMSMFGYISTASVNFVVAREKSANLVCRRRTPQNTSLLHRNPWKNVTENLCAYMDDVELEWFGEDDVDMRCTPQTALVSGTAAHPLSSTIYPSEVVWCVDRHTAAYQQKPVTCVMTPNHECISAEKNSKAQRASLHMHYYIYKQKTHCLV